MGYISFAVGIISAFATIFALFVTLGQGRYSRGKEIIRDNQIQLILDRLETGQIQLDNRFDKVNNTLEILKTTDTETSTGRQELVTFPINPDSHIAWYKKGVAFGKKMARLSIFSNRG